MRLKQTEEMLSKEKLMNSELKLSVELTQIKNKELEESLKANANRSLDTEISMEKLMDQLK